MPSKQPILPAEAFQDLNFPLAGIDVSRGYGQQMPRPMSNGQYARTTPSGINVRAYEPTTNRARGGQRAGLSKYVSTQPAGASFIQELFTLVGSGYTPPGGTLQTSSSGRVVTLVAVSGGNVYALSAGGTAWVVATNQTGLGTPLVTSGVVRSTPENQKLYFADGTNYTYYDPSTNTCFPWAATSGTLPRDSSGNTPRLICTWRGRIVLSGILRDPQNWFMSAVSSPNDFNYFPTTITPTQAVAGNNSGLGLIGDVVTALIPFSDDVLIFGGDHTIYQMSGDPMAGGQIDLISDSIGMAFGIPWCKGPDGTVYFVSNRTGIYAMQPGQGPPQRISQAIEQLLIPIDTGSNTIRLIWDDRFQGLHVFITPTSGALDANHFFWEQRAGAWWQDHFDTYNHNPLCVTVFDGNLAGDRRPLIGSWDGYVRAIDPDATDDDGTAISSSVVIGPLNSKDLDEILVKDLQAVLGETSGSVNYAVYVGSTAEKALSSDAVSQGTWNAGRNLTSFVRRSGHAVYVKLTATSQWAIETIRCRLAAQGKVRRRGY